MKEKIIREIRKEKEKKRDQKLMLMRMSFLNDMSDFIANEVEDLIKEQGDKRKKEKDWAELCQAQVKLGWPLASGQQVHLALQKLFLPVGMFTKIGKDNEVVLYLKK